MPRITALEYDQMDGEVRATYTQGLTKYGRMTNMKRTMLHSLPTYHALMEWYPLFDTIKADPSRWLATVRKMAAA